MKQNNTTFWRSFICSSVILLCLAMGGYGAARAYENTLRIGFGEYRRAVEWTEDKLQIFDFTVFEK